MLKAVPSEQQETIKKLSLSLSLPLMAIRPLALGLGPGGWRVARGGHTAQSPSQCAVRSHPAICGQARSRSRMRFHLLSALSSTPLQLSPSLSRNLPVYLYRRGSSRSITASGTTLNPGGAMKKETRLGRRSSSRPTTLYTGTIECGICDRDYMLRRGCQSANAVGTR